ncbi:MAG TPA: NAD-dependent epimerase/dehydratase family protein, partial [Anaerolineales bacterium]
MKVLVAGGAGFLGRALTKSLVSDNHEVIVLTRRTPKRSNQFQWDGMTPNGWGHLVNGVDAVVNLTGFGLEHWPWTNRQKQKFIDSRVIPGRAL